MGSAIKKQFLSDLGLVFLVGAILGMAYDYIHLSFGVLSYEHPTFASTSHWVLVEFGMGAVASALGLRWLSTRMTPPPITEKRTFLDAGLLLLSYVVNGLFAGRNLVTFFLMVLVAAASVATRPTRFVLVASAVAAVLGPLCEITLSKAGLFHYNVASPVPCWLPLLWVVASGLFIDLGMLLVRSESIGSTQPSLR